MKSKTSKNDKNKGRSSVNVGRQLQLRIYCSSGQRIGFGDPHKIRGGGRYPLEDHTPITSLNWISEKS